MRPRGEPEAIGFRRAAPLDRFLLERRGWVLGGSALLAVVCLALLPWLRFDFDPLNLKDPHSESVMTARDLMNDPMTTPYTGEILTPSIAEAEAMAARVSALPEVAQAITAASFIPEDQDKKLPIVADLALLLGPTLSRMRPCRRLRRGGHAIDGRLPRRDAIGRGDGRPARPGGAAGARARRGGVTRPGDPAGIARRRC